VQQLVRYDVVLAPLSRIRNEGKLGKHSAMFQMRWLRLIIDEGHVMANRTSSQVHVANELSAERRWCCSGTPTPGSLLSEEACSPSTSLAGIGTDSL
jgi:SNF2 family DNA or RNA helicase